ncbi:MAG: hypothetical protein SVU32_09535, partial [Candidatus Nanohaloarchaea archaeon]|nr:hypothetical protein [Candidatus Nanohaloarchaea archaeon]
MEYWMKHPETTETTDGGDIPYGTGYRITAHSHGERVHEQRVEPVETVINDTIDLTAELDPSDGQEYIIHITDLANNTASEYHLTAHRDGNTGITDYLPFTSS